MTYWMIYAIIFIGGLALSLGLIILLNKYGPASTFKSLGQNIIISLLTIFIFLMVAEIYFKLFFVQSDGWNQTLASKNWFKQYWQLNSLGYRDEEWDQNEAQTRRKILVLGDSFAAGQGIENIQDRFSNLLGAKLGDDYLVMNISTPALSTPDEIARAKGFPYKPDILILQYFINDIRAAAEQRGFFPEKPNLEPWPILNPLIENSYVFNFIYWRVVRMLPLAWQADDFAWTRAAYNDEGVWWVHQQELLTIYNAAASENIKLVVVVFPSMLDIARSREITDKVVAFFEDRQTPVLDVADMLQGLPPDQLVASPMDAHPNEWVHQQVAEKLYELILPFENEKTLSK